MVVNSLVSDIKVMLSDANDLQHYST